MLERYIVPGARFEWAFPRTHGLHKPVGAIMANPIIPIAPMKFIEVDKRIFPNSIVPTSGLQRGAAMSFDWLAYSPGSTPTCPVRGNTILTGPFSGCVFAQWEEVGIRYAGHIGTDDAAPGINYQVKNTFLDTLTPTTLGAKPDNDMVAETAAGTAAYGKYYTCNVAKVMGMLTPSLQFISFLLYQLQPAQIKMANGKMGTPVGATTFGVGAVKRSEVLDAKAIAVIMHKGPNRPLPPLPKDVVPFSRRPLPTAASLNRGRPLPALPPRRP